MLNHKSTSKNSTTIAISIAVSELVDTYCKKYSILKKDFVGLAVQWFLDNKIDIRSEVTYAPVAKGEQGGEKIETLCQLMADFITSVQNQKQLPSPAEHEAMQFTQKLVTSKDAEITRMQQQIMQDTILLEKARAELRRLSKGMFNRPDKEVMKDLGMQD